MLQPKGPVSELTTLAQLERAGTLKQSNTLMVSMSGTSLMTSGSFWEASGLCIQLNNIFLGGFWDAGYRKPQAVYCRIQQGFGEAIMSLVHVELVWEISPVISLFYVALH